MARAFSFSKSNQPVDGMTMSGLQEHADIVSDFFPVGNSQFAPKVVFRNPEYELSASSISRHAGLTFDPFDYTTIRSNTVYNDEFSMYSQYRESYMSNPYTLMVVESLLEKILGDGFHFEGPGASRVDAFFEEDKTFDKIENLIRDAVIFGNGFMDFGYKQRSEKYVRTRLLDPEQISIEIEEDIKKPDYGLRKYRQGSETLNPEFLFHLTLRTMTNKPYGISILRQNLYFLQLLLDSGGDVGAAMKRMSYAPLDIALDLEGLPTQTDKDNAITAHETKFKTFNSATNNIIHDKRHSIQLVGTGSSGGRLLPTNQMLEPLISVILRNAGMPIGIFLQQGANKAIVMEQNAELRSFFTKTRRIIKRELERNIIQRLAKSKCELIWNKAPPETVDTQNEMQTMMMCYDTGLITREQFLDMFDIDIDNAGTYKEQPSASQNTSHKLATKPGVEKPNYESGEV